MVWFCMVTTVSSSIAPTQPSGTDGEDENSQGYSDGKIDPELVGDSDTMVLVNDDIGGGGDGGLGGLGGRVRVQAEAEIEKTHPKQRTYKCSR